MSKPEKIFNQGNCKAIIFENEIEIKGKTVKFKKVEIQKSYKDKNGKWKSTNIFGVNELPKLGLAITKAYDYLTGKDKGI